MINKKNFLQDVIIYKLLMLAVIVWLKLSSLLLKFSLLFIFLLTYEFFIYFYYLEKATSEKSTAEDWAKIMEICDKVTCSPQHAGDCLRSIMKRLNAQDPHIVMLAITVSNIRISFSWLMHYHAFVASDLVIVTPFSPNTVIRCLLE